MHWTAVMPTAKTLFEPESPQGTSPPAPQQLQERGEEGGSRVQVHSPCTPPLQSIDLHAGGCLDKPPVSRADILDWSPQTPESLPVTSIRDVVHAEAAGERRPPSRDGPSAAAPAPSSSLTTSSSAAAAAAGVAPPLPPPVHVDPFAGGNSAPAAGPSTAVNVHDGAPRHAVFFARNADPHVARALLLLITSCCDLPTLVQLMRVNRASHAIATSDDVWKTILCDLNLPPLLTAFDRKRDLYTFFLDEVVTTHALHGHYTFQAANTASGSHGSVSNTSGSRAGGTHHRDDDSLQEDVFNIASLQLLISAASLGQLNHSIGRVQLLLTYKNDSMEVLQGSCRFSVFRRCFSLCCSAFGTVKRGPVFTVAVATVTKPWANEGFEHFSEHKNGIRLVMTPVLWEGQSPGSQITEKDILVVSRPRPESGAEVPTDASLAESPMQPCG